MTAHIVVHHKCFSTEGKYCVDVRSGQVKLRRKMGKCDKVPPPVGTKSKAAGIVHIALASDSTQWRGLQAAVRSMIVNSNSVERLHFHIFVLQKSAQSKVINDVGRARVTFHEFWKLM